MLRDYFGRVRLLNRDTWLIIASSAMVYFAPFGLVAVLFNLYLLRLGYGPDFVGLVNGAGFIAGTLASLPGAEIGRRWGTRRAALIGLSSNTILWCLLLLSFWLRGGWQSVWLVAGMCLLNLSGWGLYGVNILPFTMDATSVRERDHAFSLLSAMTAALSFLGASAGGVLPSLAGRILHRPLTDPAPFALSLVGAPLAFLLATVLLARTSGRVGNAVVGRSGAGQRAKPPMRGFAAMALVMLVMWAGTSSVTTFYNVYLDDALRVSTATIGIIMAAGSLLAVPASLLAPLALARLGGARTYVVASLGIAAASALLALVARSGVAASAYLATQALVALARPGINILQMEVIPIPWRTTMSAVVTIALTLGSAAMAFLGGRIIVSSGYRTLFLVGCGLVLLGAALFALFFARGRPGAPAGPQATA